MPRSFSNWNQHRRPDAKCFTSNETSEQTASQTQSQAHSISDGASLDGLEVLEGLVDDLIGESGPGLLGLADMDTDDMCGNHEMHFANGYGSSASNGYSCSPGDACQSCNGSMAFERSASSSGWPSQTPCCADSGAPLCSSSFYAPAAAHGSMQSQVQPTLHEGASGGVSPTASMRDDGAIRSPEHASPPYLSLTASGSSAGGGSAAGTGGGGGAGVGGGGSGAGGSGRSMASHSGATAAQGGARPEPGEPPEDEKFTWQDCPFLVQKDCSGIRIEPATSLTGRLPVQIELSPPLLYWKERRRWMWHKKWCLPRLHVRVTQPGALQAVAAAGQRLLVMVTAGTLRDGHFGLADEGLSGECELPLDGGEVTFSSLLFQHTSFNCGNRPFHLVVTVLAASASAPLSAQTELQAIGAYCSSPIHVDARKRTKGERPEASADDVRLLQRQRGPAGESRTRATAAPDAHAAAAQGGGGSQPSGAARQAAGADGSFAAALRALVDSMGSTVLELRSDLLILSVVSSSALGYAPHELIGRSLLAFMHVDEHNALSQTTAALLAMAASQPQASAVRALHRGMVRTAESTVEPVALDSNFSVLKPSAGPPQLLFCARYALPSVPADGALFRVFPANSPMFFPQ